MDVINLALLDFHTFHKKLSNDDKETFNMLRKELMRIEQVKKEYKRNLERTFVLKTVYEEILNGIVKKDAKGSINQISLIASIKRTIKKSGSFECLGEINYTQPYSMKFENEEILFCKLSTKDYYTKAMIKSEIYFIYKSMKEISNNENLLKQIDYNLKYKMLQDFQFQTCILISEDILNDVQISPSLLNRIFIKYKSIKNQYDLICKMAYDLRLEYKTSTV